jgi:hypothetical protein
MCFLILIGVLSFCTGIMAGSPCPIEVMKKIIDAFHMPEVTVSSCGAFIK